MTNTSITIYDDDEPELAAAIHETFSTDSGKTVLQWILNQCGFFNVNKSQIDPALLAFGNKLLNKGHMGITGDSELFVTALLNSYTPEGI